jgi:hypothetical protein
MLPGVYAWSENRSGGSPEMNSARVCRRGEGKGWSIGCLVVVILIVGGLFLYQQNGGTIYGPGGLFSLPEVTGLTADFEPGMFSHDLLLKNGSSSDLKEVDLTVTLYREDGEKPVVKQFWSNWSSGEVKKVNVPSHNYQKVRLTGSAIQDSERRHINIGWTWTRKSKQ